MPASSASSRRGSGPSPQSASSTSAVKAKHSPSSTESRLKDAARCSVMGSSAAAANSRLPKGALRTASDASAANSTRLASRPSIRVGTKPSRKRYPINTPSVLARYSSGLVSVCNSSSIRWLSNRSGVVVNSLSMVSCQVNTVVFSS